MKEVSVDAFGVDDSKEGIRVFKTVRKHLVNTRVPMDLGMEALVSESFIT